MNAPVQQVLCFTVPTKEVFTFNANITTPSLLELFCGYRGVASSFSNGALYLFQGTLNKNEALEAVEASGIILPDLYATTVGGVVSMYVSSNVGPLTVYNPSTEVGRGTIKLTALC